MDKLDWGFLDTFMPMVNQFVIDVILAVVIFIVGTKVIKILLKGYHKWSVRKDLDEGVEQFLGSLLKAVLYVLLIFLILTLFGVTAASVIAVIGSAGLTLGLALQGSLANFAGGVIILLMKPFKVGDYIIEDTNKNEGTVEKISLFYTTLVTADRKKVLIPNGVLANSSMTNTSQEGKRRVTVNVGVSYQADLDKTKELMLAVMDACPHRLQDEESGVFVAELADSCVMMGAWMWADTDNYGAARGYVLENIKKSFDSHGIEIPYPQMEVTLKNPS